jgi:p-aminobenzoyl-glutamate transporter AbgT
MVNKIFGIGVGTLALVLVVLPLNAIKGVLQGVHPTLGTVAGYAGMPIKFVISLVARIPKLGDAIAKPLNGLYA